MAKCQIKGCDNNVPTEKKLCNRHFSEVVGTSKPKVKRFKPNGPGTTAPRKKKIESDNRIPPFVLRGSTLTINYSHMVKHIHVDRLTRAAKYNEMSQGSDRNFYKYIIDIKQGSSSVTRILYENKRGRDKDFEILVKVLSEIK
jgi:hypothetical protein